MFDLVGFYSMSTIVGNYNAKSCLYIYINYMIYKHFQMSQSSFIAHS